MSHFIGVSIFWIDLNRSETMTETEADESSAEQPGSQGHLCSCSRSTASHEICLWSQIVDNIVGVVEWPCLVVGWSFLVVQ